MVPLYKGKGCDQDGDNYRALSIMHPLAKLIMGILTSRLDAISEEQNIHAPMQAGFRKGHTLEDLVLLV